MGDQRETQKHPQSNTAQPKQPSPIEENTVDQPEIAQMLSPSQEIAASGNPQPPSPETVIRLQRLYGNQRTQQMIAEGRVAQRKKPTLPNIPGVTQPKHQPQETNPALDNEQAIETDSVTDQSLTTAIGAAPPASPDGAAAETQIQRQPTTETPASKTTTPNVDIQQTTHAPGTQRFFGKALQKGAEWAFEKAMQAVGIPAKLVMGFLKKAGGVFMNIIKNPGGFLSNLISGLKQGFSSFSTNILKHLKTGFVQWLFGAVAKAGIQIPQSFSIQSILTMVMQILGTTADAIKQRLAKFIGEKNVARIEKAWGIISQFITNGIGGLWNMLKNYVGNLKEMVIGELKNWVIMEIIKNGVLKLISMFNPVSGLASIAKMIYNVIKFVMERGRQIAELVQAVVGSVAAIASGNVSAMAQKIEQALARAIPVVIGFMMSLLGLGGISKKIRDIVMKIQKKIQNAIDKMIQKVANSVKKLFGRGKGGKDAKNTSTSDKQAQVKAGLAAIKEQERQYLVKGGISKENAQKVASSVKNQHPVFDSIQVRDADKMWRYDYTVVQRNNTPQTPKSSGQPSALEQKIRTQGQQHQGNFPITGSNSAILYRVDPQTNEITYYAEYDSNGMINKRVDLVGKAHAGIPTPHVLEYGRNVRPKDKKEFPKPPPRNMPRPARPDEIP